ncbi:RNA polymerase-associated protein RapA [Congregibacter brevis]|uniref:RNA polymerase-associated protein RapA n=1 Tax=Congregibacter brevis TaxID=3081201 RepID=A0ABZ0IBF6_9GAMM|nr:RNA polymerase-associated protein RapA [Congregibacter sp. IMCC45268]
MSFAIGQRWLSHADSELGLGIIVELDGRRVSVHFPAVEEERTYATENAPLTRVKLREGDVLHTRDGRKLQVLAIHEEQELLIYEVAGEGQRELLAELDMDDHIDLATPRQRLLASQYDSHAAFALRMATAQHIHRLQQSGLRGLLGTRTALLPHQLYVANEVGKRHAPRVLLADEVGLGKTIEAGMILHRQLLSGDSRRVLIMVPESLQFQWLVEMRRRFNLNFALFDESRLSESDDGGNPFEDEQLVLCSTSLFLDANARALALDAEWDMLIVDEVHRLAWSQVEVSEDFRFLQDMAEQVPGLLLLTATPEQVGQEAHFARLALLDPERFHDFTAFEEEESQYKRWSSLMDALDRGEDVQGLPSDIDPEAPSERQIAALLDRYGTGRVLFRNARASVGGFPTREMLPHPLPMVENPVYQNLYPDLHVDTELWLQEDPRVAWLVSQLKSLRPQKVLVICATADTALALESYLQLRAGIRSAAFHEQLSLVERDRAAAYFAEQEQGAQALICSEIGGEGRNFQFAQHLILFDLPEHPDQLEQRIGRLDRIGQRDRIFIHVPYIEGSAQETLMRWYHEGIDLFRSSCSAGDMILNQFRSALDEQLRQQNDRFDELLQETARFTTDTRKELSEGRDKLLERSSCNTEQGLSLGEAIGEIEDPERLGSFLEQLCDVTGVEHEEHSKNSSVLRRGEQELLEIFPEVPEDGCTVTVSRDQALQREDWIFLGWEHPWMENAMSTVLGSALGQASVGAMSLKGVPGGSRLYELLFTVSLSAPRALGLQRYLPLAPQRILLDANGRDLSKLLTHERLNERVEKIPRGTVSKVVRQLREEIETRIDDAEQHFASELESRQALAAESYSEQLDEEIARLSSLRKVNPSIRHEEIENLKLRKEAGLAALSTARATLQGVRLVITR